MKDYIVISLTIGLNLIGMALAMIIYILLAAYVFTQTGELIGIAYAAVSILFFLPVIFKTGGNVVKYIAFMLELISERR